MLSRRSILVSSAALATAGAAPVSAQTPAAAVRPGVHGRQIPLFTGDNRPIVMMRVAGGPPAPMVFDTGASANSLDTPYAQLIGAERIGDAEVIDGSKGVALEGAYEVRLPDVSIGGVDVGEQKADVYPRHAFNEAGIVGLNAFMDQLVMMDLGRSRLYIRPLTPDSLPRGKSAPHFDRIVEGLPSIEVRLPGFSAQGIVDSGYSGQLSLPLEMADRLPLEAPPVEVGRAVSVGGSQPVYGARLLGEIKVGHITLDRPLLSFKGQLPTVGIELLRRMILVFDPRGSRTWVMEPGTPKTPLSDYVGRYGNRSVVLENEALIYQRDGQSRQLLKPYADDLFDLDDNVSQIQFVRENGRVVGLDLLGRALLQVARTGDGA